MKKIFFLILLVMISFGASACQNSNNSAEKEQQSVLSSQMENKIGQIESLGGAYSENQATNLLKQIDGSTILLKSSDVNLNDDNYKDKMVEVSGIIDTTTDGKDIMTVHSIDVLEQNKSMVMDVPNWIDYQSPSLGIGFKYRDDYKIDEAPGSVTLTKVLVDTTNVTSDLGNVSTSTAAPATPTLNADQSNLPTSQIKFEKVDGFSDIGSYLNVDVNNVSDLLAKGYTKSKIGSAYYSAYKSVIQTGNKIEYLFENSNTVIKITFDILNPAQDQSYTTQQNYFYDVLASLKIGSDVTATTDNNSSGITEGSDSMATSMSTGTTADPSTNNTTASNTEMNSQTISDSQTPDNSTTSTTTQSSNTTETVSMQDMSGYSQFQSTAMNFSIYYPKSYYFANGSGSNTYQFGDKPIDQQPGDINLEINSGGALPSGSSQTIGGHSVVMSSSSGNVSYSYKAASGRIFTITGPQDKTSILQSMIGSITES